MKRSVLWRHTFLPRGREVPVDGLFQSSPHHSLKTRLTGNTDSCVLYGRDLRWFIERKRKKFLSSFDIMPQALTKNSVSSDNNT